MSSQSNRAGRFAGRFLGLGVGLVALTVSTGAAQAHITLKTPKPWTMVPTGQKGPPPCGNTPAMKSPTTYKPGETIMVEWDETIRHAGRFRIAVGKAGQMFPNPMTAKDTSTTMPVFVDGIDPKTGTNGPTAHTRMITLPSEPCADCILQLIQVMKVNPPYNAAADQDVYYQCAAIVIAGDPAGGGDGGAPMGGADGGAGAGGGGGAGTGGSPGTGGSMSTGGASGTGGAPGTGGKPGTGGSKGDTGGAGGDEETGGSGGSKRTPPGGCSVGGGASGGGLLLLAALAILRRRRR